MDGDSPEFICQAEGTSYHLSGGFLFVCLKELIHYLDWQSCENSFSRRIEWSVPLEVRCESLLPPSGEFVRLQTLCHKLSKG